MYLEFKNNLCCVNVCGLIVSVYGTVKGEWHTSRMFSDTPAAETRAQVSATDE